MKENVLHLIDSFHQGGSERQAVQVARFMHERGRYNVHLACLDRSGVLLDEALAIGLEIPEYKLTSFYDRNTLRQLRRFAGHLRQLRIDVLQAYDFYTNVFGMAAAALARVPLRIAARRETDGLRTNTQKFVERQSFKLAHMVVVNANEVGRQLLRDGVPEKKIVTVYNGIDTSRITSDVRLTRDEILNSFGLPSGRRFITIVANLKHPMKDQATFLRAARQVKREVPDAAFVLAGEGPLIEPMRTLATELGIECDVFFIGLCRRVSELLSISEVCVLSSKGVEGFSNSIIEYMAAARPVVATDVGGAREAISEGESGYIVNPGDDAMMAARIVSLLKDPETGRAMGQFGLRLVKEKFSCEQQVQQLENLYQQFFNRGSSTEVFAGESAQNADGVTHTQQSNVSSYRS
jgi:L-malate glycosyltransferase